MNILIATDGALPIDHTVRRVQRVYREGDTLTVMTAVNLPRRMVAAMGDVDSFQTNTVAEVVDAIGPGLGGDRIAERLKRKHGDQVPVEEFLRAYHQQVAAESTKPLGDALAEAGMKAKTIVRESQERTAATVIDVVREVKADLLVLGDTGRGRFEGLLGSTGTKLVRHAPCDVMLIRVPS